MEKEQKIFLTIISIIFIVAVSLCSYFGYKHYESNKNNALRFKKEYESLNNNHKKYIEVNISDDNIIKYKTAKEIIDILKSGTGVIFLGAEKDNDTRLIINTLLDTAKEKNIKEIYYLNIGNIDDSYEIVNESVVKNINGTKEYYKLVKILDEYLDFYTIKDENDISYNTGEKRIISPTVVVVKEGNIKGFYSGIVNIDEKTDNLNEKEIKKLKSGYSKIFSELTKQEKNKKKK